MAKAVIESPKIIVAEDGRTYTFDEVATYVKYHAPNAKQEEIEEFFNYCKLRSLSPYDVHFIKYGNSQPVIVVGKDAFLKRAERSKQLDGYKAGVITVNRDTGEVTYRNGAFYIKSKEELVGGWAEVYRKDFNHPIRTEVAIEEYARKTKDGKLMSNWATMPATMIRKVALVQALREAFPSEMSGMYVAEEMGVEIDEETGEVLNTKPVENSKIELDRKYIKGIHSWSGLAEFDYKSYIREKFGKESSKQLTKEEAIEVIKEAKERWRKKIMELGIDPEYELSKSLDDIKYPEAKELTNRVKEEAPIELP
ncbi:phage recombination protein Bet [Balnearium lithotrophicum]|uniref:Phage recombination protein Bet n=1 Tax=Balnearium lithotrophicum TaxID=223788 RepID=A0A521CNX4_9BACT|nr:phage recombination protein Bet [Balnearium lithotrophicum]SMO61154.1 phage recombination protein Bet [Balnearium lithotrophicum]